MMMIPARVSAASKLSRRTLRRRKGTDVLADLQGELLLDGALAVVFELGLERDEGVDGLAGHLVAARSAQSTPQLHALDADDGAFADARVLNQRSLDLGRGQAMARDVNDVVDTAADPVVRVLVDRRTVAGELR